MLLNISLGCGQVTQTLPFPNYSPEASDIEKTVPLQAWTTCFSIAVFNLQISISQPNHEEFLSFFEKFHGIKYSL